MKKRGAHSKAHKSKGKKKANPSKKNTQKAKKKKEKKGHKKKKERKKRTKKRKTKKSKKKKTKKKEDPGKKKNKKSSKKKKRRHEKKLSKREKFEKELERFPKEPTALKEEAEIQRKIEKETRYLLSPEELPVVLFICSLIVLAFMLDSISMIFYTATTLFVLWLAHFFHKHKHRPHDIIAILGIFFLPVLVSLIAYRDLLMWFLLFVYTLSAVSTLLIYHYQKREHQPLKIMWQTTYSKVAALTAGTILVSILPALMPETFISITSLLMVYVLPVVLVVFLISKFLYIYYFEHKHIKHDIWVSIRYAVIYALAFVLIMTASYALLAVQMQNDANENFNRQIDLALLDTSKIDKIIGKMPQEIRVLTITYDIKAYNKQLMEDIREAKNWGMQQELAFGSILDGTYMDTIREQNHKIKIFKTKIKAVLDAKETLTGRHNLLQETIERNATLPDGSKDLEKYKETLKRQAEERYIPYYMNRVLAETLSKVEDPATTYEYFEENGINWFFADREGLRAVYHSESLLMMQVMKILRHTEPYRVFAKESFLEFLSEQKEEYSGHLEQEIWEKREKDETDMSKVLRYEILLEKVKERPPMLKMKEARKQT